MNRGRVLATARAAGLGVAVALGGGILYVPEFVAPAAGPAAPLAFLLAGAGVVCVAAAFAVLASGPFGDGPLYRAVSRTWGSRLAGVLVAWPAFGAYVALTALLANWFGRLAPLPPGAGVWAGVVPAQPVSPLLGGTPPVGDVTADVIAVAACAVALAVHLAGPRRAALAVAVPVWACVLALAGALALAFVPGVGEFVPRNYDRLLPTSDLREAPVARLLGGAAVALFAFAGVEASATGARASDREIAPAGTLLAASALAGLTTLAAFVSLGVVNWARLTQADVPTADAMAAYLPLDPTLLAALGSVVFGWTALVALGFPAARTLAALGELAGSDSPVTRPSVALTVTYGVASVVVVADLVAPALSLALPALAMAYLAVVLTAAALPGRRPDLWAECSFRPSRPVRRTVAAGGVLAAGTMLAFGLTRDPASVLSWTLHSPALTPLGLELVSDPLRSTVPALLGWELLAFVLLVVLRDYREARGAALPPLSGSGDEP